MHGRIYGQINGIRPRKTQRIEHAAHLLRPKLCIQPAPGLFQQSGGLAQGFVVRLRNAAAGQDVMELVHQQGLPQRPAGGAARGRAAVHGCQHRDQLKVVQGGFGHAVVLFDLLFARQRSAVQLQIKLSPVFGKFAALGLQALHKLRRAGVAHPGAALQVRKAARCFDHLKLGAAAAVSVPEGDEPLVGDLFVSMTKKWARTSVPSMPLQVKVS